MIMVFNVDNSIFNSSHFIDRVYALIFYFYKKTNTKNQARTRGKHFFSLKFCFETDETKSMERTFLRINQIIKRRLAIRALCEMCMDTRNTTKRC